MAKVAKLKSPAVSGKRSAIGSLPESLSEPPPELGNYALMIFGEKGIGKTSLAAQFPGALILQLEPRRRNVRVWQKPIRPYTLRELRAAEKANGKAPVTPWQELCATIDTAIADDRVKTLVIDTVDRAYDACLAHWCYTLGINDPSDVNDYGATWRQIKDDFEEVLNRILYAETKGLVLISHAIYREVETRGGIGGYEVLMPSCAPAALKTIKAIADFAFYYGYYGKQRALFIQGDEHIWSACGVEDHFLSVEGKRLRVISMGNSAAEAYQRLLAAYNNKASDLVED